MRLTKEQEKEVARGLEEIHDEMQDLVLAAEEKIRGSRIEASAKHYWLAQLKIALGMDHEYLAHAGETMAEAIAILDGYEDEE